MFPSKDALTTIFAFQHSLAGSKSQYQHFATPAIPINRDPFPAWSAVDDVKSKANSFGKEAAREFNLASQKVQAKTGKIEMFSPQYYAVCITGGLLACVSIWLVCEPQGKTICEHDMAFPISRFYPRFAAFRVTKT
jgi:solute carrier family 25 (mitochondrial phosphate transporter), member 3